MPERTPANLLLVTFDQWRGDWGDPHAPVVPLPALQRLAQQGWTARRCYTSSPQCVPARLSWLTGLAPSQLGVTRNLPVDVPADAPSLVRQLREAGWYTALVGKTHWTSHDGPFDLRDNAGLLGALGFTHVLEVAGPRALQRVSCALTDAWREAGVLERQRADLAMRYGDGRSPAAWRVRPSVLPSDLYPDLWIAERGLEALAAMPNDQPWLLWVSFVGPHEPFDTPAPWHGRNSAAALPPAQPKPIWLHALPPSCELRQTELSWSNSLSDAAIAACRADYADHLQLLDEQLQRLLQALRKRDDQSRTAVAVTADHGELLGDSGMLYKGTFLEGAVRVPWIYRAPTAAERPSSTLAPLPLTGLIAQTLAGLPTGGHCGRLQRWSQRQRGAVVEFGDELLLVQGQRKLAVDPEGQPLWAVDLAHDPMEQRNVITADPVRWRWSRHWRALRSWSRIEWRRRQVDGWIWRHLPLHTSEAQR
jgi:arylsulfatase